MNDQPFRLLIASPIGAEHVERMRGNAPEGVEIVYEPDLLPPMRYTGDHGGMPGHTLTSEQQERWNGLLASADALFDFPWNERGRHPREYAPNVKWIQTTSAGVGRAAQAMGIQPGELVISTASGVHARPLAEFVMMALLMGAKEYCRIVREQAAHHWERFCSDELSGKTLAIVGAGRVGREVAKLARAFDMRLVGLTREFRADRAAELGLDRLYARNELHEMLSEADAIVVCAPHTPDTENMIGAAEFDLLKRGVTFVNIGRGQLVDEAALIEKLRDGTIGFAGLDVFQTEPLPADSPLWDFPNVIVNPHSASTSHHENGRITDILLHNLHAFIEGRHDDMRNVLDIERMY
ncbi:MAG: D-2-hydroxyacid dehydrogenase [Chloroflexota bacterium]|nr:D-2-hydroxyacid dehydrogenase [Chloroflexota bacterium]